MYVSARIMDYGGLNEIPEFSHNLFDFYSEGELPITKKLLESHYGTKIIPYTDRRLGKCISELDVFIRDIEAPLFEVPCVPSFRTPKGIRRISTILDQSRRLAQSRRQKDLRSLLLFSMSRKKNIEIVTCDLR